MTEVLIGSLLPLVIDFLNRNVESSRARAIVSILVCFLAGALMNLDNLKYGNGDEIIESMTLVFTSTKIVYDLIYKRLEGVREEALGETTYNVRYNKE